MVTVICTFCIIVWSVLSILIDKDNWWSSIISFIFAITSILCYDYSPKAMDVYRGKTELKITYKDNIPIDTVVVYK